MNDLQGSMHYTPRVVLLDLSGSLGGVQHHIAAARRFGPVRHCIARYHACKHVDLRLGFAAPVCHMTS